MASWHEPSLLVLGIFSSDHTDSGLSISCGSFVVSCIVPTASARFRLQQVWAEERGLHPPVSAAAQRHLLRLPHRDPAQGRWPLLRRLPRDLPALLQPGQRAQDLPGHGRPHRRARARARAAQRHLAGLRQRGREAVLHRRDPGCDPVGPPASFQY